MRGFGLFVLCAGLALTGCAEDEVGTDTPSDAAVDTTAADAADTAAATDTRAPDTAAPEAATDTAAEVATDTATAADTATDTAAAADTATDTAAAADTAAATDTAAEAAAEAGPTVSFSADVQPIFTGTCTGCHSGAAASAGLNLSSGSAYANLVGIATNCGSTIKRVTPGSTANSMLWRKLANDPARCGSAMPLGSGGLKFSNPTAFAKIEAWIAEGAPNN